MSFGVISVQFLASTSSSVSSSLKDSSLTYPPVPPNVPNSPLTSNVLCVTLYFSLPFFHMVFQLSFSSSSDAHTFSHDPTFSCAACPPLASVPAVPIAMHWTPAAADHGGTVQSDCFGLLCVLPRDLLFVLTLDVLSLFVLVSFYLL